MRLAELLARVPGLARVAGPPEIAIAAIEEDSRRCAPGALFVARGGRSDDGRRFLEDSRAAGAVAALVAPDATARVPSDMAAIVPVDGSSVAVAGARLAEAFHGFPSRTLRLAGVTGTNGKTTIAFMLRQLLAEAGEACGLIGTVEVDDGAERTEALLTTPGACALSSLLARMVANGCRACAMECSSHALAQDRTAALRFAAAIFTNLTGDHLDYHGTMEAYAAAKARLFEGLGPDATAIVSADDPAWPRMVRDCRAPVVRCSLRDSSADWFAHLERADADGTHAKVRGPHGAFALRLPLPGLHNLLNALQAAAGAAALGVPLERIEAVLARIAAPPGRLEPASGAEDDLSVFVDYAHTDDALDNVLRAVRPLVPAGARLVVLFGCGGDRDRTKRPRMAAVAARLADSVVITSDNPRTESPEAIVEEIAAGLPPPSSRRVAVRRIVDRAEAIERTIESAGPGDIVVIAGKGHERSQIVGHERRPFDDAAVARAALARRRLAPMGCGR